MVRRSSAGIASPVKARGDQRSRNNGSMGYSDWRELALVIFAPFIGKKMSAFRMLFFRSICGPGVTRITRSFIYDLSCLTTGRIPMKLMRVGPAGQENPAILDNDGKVRDLSAHVKD